MKANSILFSLSCALFWAATASAQTPVPVPAPVQTQAIVIRGATAHLGNGRVIQNSVIAFERGKLTVVDAADAKRLPIAIGTGHREIDATGKHAYPGFIAPDTELGLTEIGAIRATRDASELGDFNSNIRSIISYNTDSHIPPTVRSMGVLLAEVVPQGGRISGSSSVVQLDAWNWEDAALATDIGLHLNWPSSSSFNFEEQRVTKNENYDKQLREMEDFFTQAQAYLQKAAPEVKNLRFEAMRGTLDWSKRLFIHTNSAQGIREAVLFAEKFGITPVLVGARDAWMLTDFLKKHNVAVIIGSTQATPGREDEDIDQPFKTPAMLQQAGVQWCFSHEGFWQQRNLPFQAGQAVGFGLGYEDAIAALTSSTAKILGIDKQAGTLEAGKDATLFLSEGDALDMRTSKLTHAFIQGREINLDNKQEMLYRRFQMKYKSR